MCVSENFKRPPRRVIAKLTSPVTPAPTQETTLELYGRVAELEKIKMCVPRRVRELQRRSNSPPHVLLK